MKSLNELFRELIFKNECGSESVVYQLSDADGKRSGKSGYSFGVCQFDTQNNSQALACLSECGFTHDEIDGIVKQAVDVKPFSSRLKANADIIERYDQAQLSRCLYAALDAAMAHNVECGNTSFLLAAADYVNQYGSIGDGFCSYMNGLDRPLVAKDVLDFKLHHTKYGKNEPADCRRRYNNLIDLLKREGIEV